MKILAIESSCDETACAVVEDGVTILSNVVASSTAMHEKYGGIVPELAAREQLRCILPVIKEAVIPLQQFNNLTIQQCINKCVDAVAVTVGPGLIGSLLVGVETAKTIAFVCRKPLIPVNHVLAHMYANFLESAQENSPRVKSRGNNIKIPFPAVSLVVSGGHTELYLMKSIKDLRWLGGALDDAAGECFDKTARLLGFGAGGGVAIQEAAQTHPASRIPHPAKLPRPMINDNSLNFSFSGLKTALLREVEKLKNNQQFNPSIPSNVEGLRAGNITIQQLASEVQEAITDVLVVKTIKAAHIYNAKSILISGGVAANLRLREKFKVKSLKCKVIAPPVQLCTDNAVMIGSYAFFRGKPLDWHQTTALPDLPIEVSSRS